jgi:hypothetical protein
MFSFLDGAFKEPDAVVFFSEADRLPKSFSAI